MDGHAWEMNLEPAGEDELQGIVEGDETLIKGGIVKTGEAQAVADIEALSRVLCPWENMGGDQ
jgi:hypothetical protein